MVGAHSGIITAAGSFEENLCDGRTLPTVLDQAGANTGRRPEVALVDRGFRGPRQAGKTAIVMPQAEPWPADKAGRQRRRRQNARRVSIEPRIGHLKSDFRLGRNFLHGVPGDAINVLLACAASNLRKWLRLLTAFLRALPHLLVFPRSPAALRFAC